ncbi:glycosyl transferase [Thermoplasmatales archaeon SW_10_69_26]|nr:MAG: glycosyl transferase [Thermoplasmatales archaeon SW_10_69_26]
MKVAMIGWEFPPFIAGGLGVHSLELTAGLARSGVDIDFYMPRMETGEDQPQPGSHHDHVEINEVAAAPAESPYAGTGGSQTSEGAGYGDDFNQAVDRYNDRVVDAFDAHDADLLHCHDWITVPGALEIRRRTGLPLVFTVHSTEYDRSAGLDPQHWIETIERRGVHEAERVIAVSEYTKQLVEDRYDADPDTVVAIHNGVDLARWDQPPEPRTEQTAGTVLFLSRLVRQKGPLFFLEAAERVLEQAPQARFVVTGKGSMLRECLEHTIDRGIADRVHFTGFVPEEELAEVYQASDVYVLPSVSEPFGITVLEAMASGVPTIVSKTSGVGEALDHVLTVDFWDTDELADLILGVLDHEPLRSEMRTRGGEEVRQFSWDDTCRETLSVYEDLLQETPTVEVTAR